MIKGMNHITLAVKDINKSFRFYSEILGLKPLVKWDKGAYFLTDDFWFYLNVDELHQPTVGYTHYAFTVNPQDFDNMSQQIINSGATVFKDNTSPGDSLYFLDPDGHKLEIHTGNWKSRVDAKKVELGHWKKVEWFI